MALHEAICGSGVRALGEAGMRRPGLCCGVFCHKGGLGGLDDGVALLRALPLLGPLRRLQGFEVVQDLRGALGPGFWLGVGLEWWCGLRPGVWLGSGLGL